VKFDLFYTTIQRFNTFAVEQVGSRGPVSAMTATSSADGILFYLDKTAAFVCRAPS